MTPSPNIDRYKNHRFPGEIISHGVWLYHRFSLSYRGVQEFLMVRKWCGKFAQDDANRLRRRRPQPGDKGHLAEAFLTIHGECHYLWRAGDQDDNVLDVVVQSHLNKRAAKTFFRKLNGWSVFTTV
jgi:putative transposase